MMNLKNLKNDESGFMLMEVLMALAVVAIVSTPVFRLVRNSLFLSYRYYRKRERIFEMKHMILEQMYRSKEQKQEHTKEDKKPGPPQISLRYTREKIKKDKMFEKIPENQLQHLCVQKVESPFGERKKDYLGCLFYKPDEREAK